MCVFYFLPALPRHGDCCQGDNIKDQQSLIRVSSKRDPQLVSEAARGGGDSLTWIYIYMYICVDVYGAGVLLSAPVFQMHSCTFQAVGIFLCTAGTVPVISK